MGHHQLRRHFPLASTTRLRKIVHRVLNWLCLLSASIYMPARTNTARTHTTFIAASTHNRGYKRNPGGSLALRGANNTGDCSSVAIWYRTSSSSCTSSSMWKFDPFEQTGAECDRPATSKLAPSGTSIFGFIPKVKFRHIVCTCTIRTDCCCTTRRLSTAAV